MDNKLIVGLIVGGALIVGFAAGRFTAPTDTLVKEVGEKSSSKTKVATTKHGAYRPPNANAQAGATPETPPPAHKANPGDRGGRGKFDPAAYAATMKERAVSERANLVSKVNLSPAQQQDFDDLVSAMNSSLKQRSEKFLAMMKDGKPPTPEAGYRMLFEYSSSMMRTYDVMDRTMPPDWREKVGSTFDLRNFVDPEIRMATRGFRGGGGPPGGGNGGGGAGGPPQR